MSYTFYFYKLKMNIPLNCITEILSYLSDCDLYRFCQINKNMANLRNKDNIWITLWQNQYPDNYIYSQLTPYQNYLRLSLVRKFLELNSHLLKGWYGTRIAHSDTPKRRLDRAMFIPITGIGENEDRVLPDSLERAFNSVNIILPNFIQNYESEAELEFANWLLKTDNLFLKPKKGDILVFVEWACDLNDKLLIYNGIKIDYFWRVYDYCYLSNIQMHWPSVPLNYWHYYAIVPTNIKQQFKQNLTISQIPSTLKSITDINYNIYSWASMSNRTIYLLFVKEYSSTENFDRTWDWNIDAHCCDRYGYETTVLKHVNYLHSMEYVIFNIHANFY